MRRRWLAMTSQRALNLVMVSGLLVSFAIANVVAQGIAGGGTQDLESGSFQGPPNVQILPRNPAMLPEPTDDDVVLLVGNSHTYALPSLDKGQPLQPDNGETLIYRLAGSDEGPTADGEPPTVYRRLAYPNFLPLEMWLTIANLRAQGHSPDVIVLGVTFRNVARDFDARGDIAQIMGDDTTADAIRDLAASIDAPDALLEALDDTARASNRGSNAMAPPRDQTAATAPPRDQAAARSPRDQVAARSQTRRPVGTLATSTGTPRPTPVALTPSGGGPAASIADDIEAELREALDPIPLVGDSTQVRARVRRWAEPIWLRLLTGETGGTTYDIIDNDLNRNMEVMASLADLMTLDDTRVIVYFAPERTDLPPVIDRSSQQEVVDRLRATFEARGIEVLDASPVVPNEYWGYDGDFADRSHFTSEGHRLLAEFLVEATGGVDRRSP